MRQGADRGKRKPQRDATALVGMLLGSVKCEIASAPDRRAAPKPANIEYAGGPVTRR